MDTVTITINSQIKIVLPKEEYELAFAARGWVRPKNGTATRMQKAVLKNAYPEHVVITPHRSIGYREFVALYKLGLLENAYQSNRDGSGTVRSLLLLGQYTEDTQNRIGKLSALFAQAHGAPGGITSPDPAPSHHVDHNIKGAPKSFHSADILLRKYLDEADRAYKAIAILPRPDGTAAKWVSLKSDRESGDYRYVLWQPEEFTPVLHAARDRMNSGNPLHGLH